MAAEALAATSSASGRTTSDDKFSGSCSSGSCTAQHKDCSPVPGTSFPHAVPICPMLRERILFQPFSFSLFYLFTFSPFYFFTFLPFQSFILSVIRQQTDIQPIASPVADLQMFLQKLAVCAYTRVQRVSLWCTMTFLPSLYIYVQRAAFTFSPFYLFTFYQMSSCSSGLS